MTTRGANVAMQCLSRKQTITSVRNRKGKARCPLVAEAGCKKLGGAGTHPQVGEDTP